jgi:DNA-directed RNA polymerase I subunit RPA43
MSADAPDMSKKKEKKKDKKHKKEKSEDGASKKRKRQEEDEADETVQAQLDIQAKKKHKKNKTQSTPAVTTTAFEADRVTKNSPFIQLTTSLYLPLSPCAYSFPLQGLCAEHISPLLLTYYPPLQGVLLSYSNPRLSEHPEHSAQDNVQRKILARSVDEYAVSYVWLTAEFLVFRPHRESRLEGWVGLQNESMLGLVCYNYFNAVIERDKLPEGWSWVSGGAEDRGRKKGAKDSADGTGHWVDEQGNKVEGKIVFKVDDFETSASFDSGVSTITIQGVLREES